MLRSLKCFKTALSFSGMVSLSFILLSSIPFIFDTRRRALASRSCSLLNCAVDNECFISVTYTIFIASSSLNFAWVCLIFLNYTVIKSASFSIDWWAASDIVAFWSSSSTVPSTVSFVYSLNWRSNFGSNCSFVTIMSCLCWGEFELNLGLLFLSLSEDTSSALFYSISALSCLFLLYLIFLFVWV